MQKLLLTDDKHSSSIQYRLPRNRPQRCYFFHHLNTNHQYMLNRGNKKNDNQTIRRYRASH